jgi:hypothetical protein
LKKEIDITDARRQYREAYEKHYERKKDLHSALEIYKAVVAKYPGTREEEISRHQIVNIMQEVVPKEILYNAQLNLALNYAKCKNKPYTQVEITG